MIYLVDKLSSLTEISGERRTIRLGLLVDQDSRI